MHIVDVCTWWKELEFQSFFVLMNLLLIDTIPLVVSYLVVWSELSWETKNVHSIEKGNFLHQITSRRSLFFFKITCSVFINCTIDNYNVEFIRFLKAASKYSFRVVGIWVGISFQVRIFNSIRYALNFEFQMLLMFYETRFLIFKQNFHQVVRYICICFITIIFIKFKKIPTYVLIRCINRKELFNIGISSCSLE